MSHSAAAKSSKLTTFRNGTPTLQSILTDDIICLDWLEEVGMGQYNETFLVNFSVGGNLLSRKRLSRIRVQDFAQMSIENFEHQKILINHIRHTLKYSFTSPDRKETFQRQTGGDYTKIWIKDESDSLGTQI